MARSPEQSFVGSEDTNNSQDASREADNFVSSEASNTPESPDSPAISNEAPTTNDDLSTEERIRSMQTMLQGEMEERRRLMNEQADPEKVAQGRQGEAKWRRDYVKDGDVQLRNEKGHYSTMDLEQQRAVEENERFDRINKKIEQIQTLLAELSQEVADQTNEQTQSAATSSESDPTDSSEETATGAEAASSDPESTSEETPDTAPYSVSETSEDATDETSPAEATTDDTASPESPDGYEAPATGEYEVTLDEPPVNLYDPGGTPPVPLYAPSPEVEDFRADFLRLVNDIARRDQERAIERFGGFRPFGALSGFLRLFRARGAAERVERLDQRISDSFLGRTIGRVRSWFDKVGQRNILSDEDISSADEADITENMERAGRFTKRPWWKKCLKIGGKILGGFGVAGAMVMTGGVGAATALLWSGGLKEGYDGVLQTIEDIGWGRKRGAAELERQNQMQEQIDALRQRLINNDPPITRDEYFESVNNILAADRSLMDQEANNITGERKGQMVRSLLSTGLTIGTGLFAGVPLGRLNYDNDNTAIANTFREATGQAANAPIMNETHRGFWNLLHGGQFGYEHNSVMNAIRDSLNGATPSGAEHTQMNAIIEYLQKMGTGQWKLTDLAPYGQTAHELSGGLLVPELYKLGSPIPYLLGELLRHKANRSNDNADNYRALGRTSPDDGGYRVYEADRETSGGNENGSGEGYGSAPMDRSNEIGSIQPSTEEVPATPEGAVEFEHNAINHYFESVPPAYRAEVKIASDPLPEMSEQCRVSVCVPAAYSEHRVIYSYLESFLGQTDTAGNPLNPDTYEVNIFVNGPTDKSDEISQTVAEIDRFKEEHPEIHVNVISKAFERRQNIGLLRKLVTDSALMRSQNRSAQNGELYLVTHDADIRVADNDYISNIISRMDQDRGTKMLSGEVDYSDEDKAKYPIIWSARRLWQFIDTIRSGRNYADMTKKAVGANCIIRSGAYADVNGFRMIDKIAEDLALGEKINRRYGKKASDGNNVIANFPYRTIISARRDIQSIEQGKPIIGGYDDFENNHDVRGDIPENNTPAEITPDKENLFLEHLTKEAGSQFNTLYGQIFWSLFDQDARVIEARRNRNEAQVANLVRQLQGSEVGQQAFDQAKKIFDKASGFLGIETNISPNNGRFRVDITSWEKLKQGLEEKTPEV